MDKYRPAIKIDDPVGVMATFSEGNPGALRVLMELGRSRPSSITNVILDLDDMNIRGEQIWVAYKDFSKGDIDKFITSVTERNLEMINIINRECPDHKAVKSGYSDRSSDERNSNSN